MKIGSREFDTVHGHYVMGILNVTPDSFSDGGKWNTVDAALFRVEEMISQGADLVDVGGESTRPGYVRISDEEEIARVVPVLEAIHSRFDIPISLDTYKSRVASAGIAAGADLINDIWGLKTDPDMAAVIAESQLPCILMHNRKEPDYGIFMEDVASDLAESIRLAETAGIRDDRIILDPGVGFGKSYENNLEIIDHLDQLRIFGYPILLAASRKSVIGLTLDLPASDRLEGTIATTVIGILRGATFVRVHDIEENVRAIRMTEAILLHSRPERSAG